MRRFLLCALAVLVSTSLPGQATARRRIRVEDSPCAPATAWRVRDTNYTTLTAADAAAKKPIACPAITPIPTPTPTPVPVAGTWVNVTPANANVTTDLSCGNYGTTNVVADPSQSSVLYAQFNCQGIWTSADYGVTWTGPLNRGASADCAGGISIGATGVLYQACIRGAGLGFWRSRDGGVTWTLFPITPAPSNRQDFYPPSVDPFDALHLIMAGHEQDVLVESVDGGATWSAIPFVAGMRQGGGTAGLLFVNTGSATTTRRTFLWMAQASGGGFGTWRTADAGATWAKVDNNEHTHGGYQVFQDASALYMPGVYSALGWGILRSTDLGVSWAHVGAGGNQSIVIGTPNALYGSYGYPSGLNTASGPAAQMAAQPGVSGWTAQPTPAAMLQGAASAARVYDGARYVIVTANYGAGLWRYVETATSAPPAIVVPPAPSPAPLPVPTPLPIVTATNGVPLDTGASIPLIRAATTAPATIGFEGNFRTRCNIGRVARFDPIVYPGKDSVGHEHAFFGNIGLNPNSTPETLRLSGNSTCWGATLNRTGYWVPTLRDSSTGELQIASQANIYYKSAYLDATTIQVIPAGLRMIAGDKNRTVPEEFISWNCSRTWSQQAAVDGMIPDCPVGEDVILSVGFPECWDGKNLDSPDHKSHMATMMFRNPGPSVCPASHPVPLPKITENFIFPVTTTSRPTRWRLSSDMYTTAKKGGLSAHADWMNGWDQLILTTFTKSCINATRDCTVQLGDGRELYYKP